MTIEKIFYREKELIQMLGISRNTIYRLIKNGDFPKPKKLGEKTSVYHIDDIKQFIQKIVEAEASDKPIFNI